MVRPDGTTRWIRARGEAVSDTTGRIVGLRGTAQDITERKLAEEALAGMSRKLLEAQEQERTRIARELHDDISQQLALLSVEIQQMKKCSPLRLENFGVNWMNSRNEPRRYRLMSNSCRMSCTRQSWNILV